MFFVRQFFRLLVPDVTNFFLFNFYKASLLQRPVFLDYFCIKKRLANNLQFMYDRSLLFFPFLGEKRHKTRAIIKDMKLANIAPIKGCPGVCFLHSFFAPV